MTSLFQTNRTADPHSFGTISTTKFQMSFLDHTDHKCKNGNRGVPHPKNMNSVRMANPSKFVKEWSQQTTQLSQPIGENTFG